MARYLSLEWIDDLQRAAERSPHLGQAAEGVAMVLQQHVTGGPDGEIAYHVTIDHGVVHVQPGVTDAADVAFTQDYATARQVAAGELDALQAFQDGRVAVRGDVRRLTEAQPALAALDEAFADVRRDTTY